MDYRELTPAPALRDLVRCYWFLSDGADDAETVADPALPDGSPELIFNLADPFRAFADDRPARVQPWLMLVGQITRPFVVGPTGRVDVVAVRFEAHGASLLHDDLGAITNDWADSTALSASGLEAVRVALGATDEPETRAALLDAALTRLVDERPTRDARVALAVRAIRDSAGRVALDAVARELGTTPRTLQRLFRTQVGISPKLLARITRFHRVFASWRADPGSLAHVAAECGYFDQSHLVRDFHDFAGRAPAAFLATQPEFTAFFTSTRHR